MSTLHWRKVIIIHASSIEFLVTNAEESVGVMVAGGREGLVGVGGLLLGGGVSLLKLYLSVDLLTSHSDFVLQLSCRLRLW